MYDWWFGLFAVGVVFALPTFLFQNNVRRWFFLFAVSGFSIFIYLFIFSMQNNVRPPTVAPWRHTMNQLSADWDKEEEVSNYVKFSTDP